MENSGVPAGDDYIGVLAFCSFVFSVIAAVLAIDLYALLRTGRSGSTWRVLIIASVIFALMHALRLAELLNFGLFRLSHLSEIVELMFVMALAYAFYLQRKVFGPPPRPAPPARPPGEPRANRNLKASQPAAPARSPRQIENESAQGATAEDAEDTQEEDVNPEEAALEWARLNGQSDSPVLR